MKSTRISHFLNLEYFPQSYKNLNITFRYKKYKFHEKCKPNFRNLTKIRLLRIAPNIEFFQTLYFSKAFPFIANLNKIYLGIMILSLRWSRRISNHLLCDQTGNLFTYHAHEQLQQWKNSYSLCTKCKGLRHLNTVHE